MAKLIEIEDVQISDALKAIDAQNKINKEKKQKVFEADEDIQQDVFKIEEFTKQNQEPSIFKKIGNFFSGTKTTEFENLPEFGTSKETDEYITGGKAAKIAIGFALTPNQRGQMNIIKSQMPEATFTQDKFKNIIVVMPDGKGFYLNKPGASSKDFIETTQQVLQYIPGMSYAMKAAGKSYLKRVLFSGAAGGATSIVQDIGSTAFGKTGEGKNKMSTIDLPKLAVSTFVPSVFEGVVTPVAGAIYRKFFGNPNFYKVVKKEVIENGRKVIKEDYVFTEKGKKAATAAGLDWKNLNSQTIKNFTTDIGRGVDIDIASAQAAAGKFNFRLSKSQAAQDKEGMATLYEAAKGTFGKEPQVAITNFLSKQNIDIGNTAKALISRFNKGQVGDDTLEGVGQTIQDNLKAYFRKASDDAVKRYNAVSEGVFQGKNSNIDVLYTSTKKAIEEVSEATGVRGTGLIDKELTPATVKALKSIENFVNKVKKMNPKKANPATFKMFDTELKKVNSFYNSAANKTDQKNIMAIKKEVEKFIDDNIDNFLFTGNKNSIADLKKAKALFSDLKRKFEPNTIVKGGIKIQDNAGKAVSKIINDETVTPMKTMDYIFGVSTLGRKADALTIVKRLKKIFDAEGKDLSSIAAKNADFQSLRTGFFNKLVKDSIRNNQFNKEAFVKNWETVTSRDMALVKELFDGDEIKLIDEFVNEVRKTFKPKDMVNASNTASAMMRVINGVSRQLLGIIGFKVASIQGLLFARTGFDRIRDFAGTKTARKIIDDELYNLGAFVPKSPIPVSSATGLIQKELGEERKPSVPFVPQGFLSNQ